MKIDFQPIRFNHSLLHNNNKNITASNNNDYKLSSFYYVPFGCSETNFKEQLENLSNVHCPSCGVKTIPSKDFKEFLSDAKNISTKEEFFAYTDKKKEYINPDFNELLTQLKNISKENPKMPFEQIVEILKEQSDNKINQILENKINYLDSLINSGDFSQKDKLLLAGCKSDMINMISRKNYGYFMENLKQTIYKMESGEKYKISSILKKDYMKEYINKSVLNLNFNKDKSAECQILTNLLINSLSTSVKIKNGIEENEIFNRILLCNKCSKNKTKMISDIINNNDNKLENYHKYIKDITHNGINGELGENSQYPIILHGYLKTLNSSFDEKSQDAQKTIGKYRFAKNKKIDFDLVSIDGIPCACCGKETISHKTKMDFYTQIENAKDKFEILDILKENNHLIRGKYKIVIKNYEKLLQENPNISDKEMYEKLREMSRYRIKGALTDNIVYAEQLMKSDAYNYKERILLQKFINKINEFKDVNYERVFDIKNYNKMVKESLSNFSYSRRSYLYNVFTKRIKDLYCSQLTLFQYPDVIARYDSPLKLVAQDIIKQSVATKDHLVAKNLSGEDNIDNIVLLCKDCNQNKSNSDVYHWVLKDKSIAGHFQKQINYIYQEILNGNIDKEYLSYINKLQAHAYEKSNGRINLKNPDIFVI